MRRAALPSLLALAFMPGCTAAATPDPSDAGPDLGATVTDGSDGSDGSDGAPVSRDAATVSGTFTFTLDAGAFAPTPAHPSVLVYLPGGFHPTRPIDVIVYLHGHSNCVDNIIRDAGTECTAGAGVRSAYSLAAQLEASGKNALLLAPEVVYDAADGNPGALGQPGGFRALLAEVLLDLKPVLGAVGIADVGKVIVASHSGGYQAAAGIANVGGVAVDELYLLDSLYGSSAPFETWVKNNLGQLSGSPPPRRFADAYLKGGTTETGSLTMANNLAGLADAGVLLDDRTVATWSDSMYLHGVLFKASSLAHNDIPRYYFGRFVQTSGLSSK